MRIDDTVSERHNVVRREPILVIAPNMERRQHDGCVRMVRRSLREGAALVPLHEGEKTDQPLLDIDRHPDREVQAIRDVYVAVVIDLGLQEGTTKQLRSASVETSSSLMTSIALISSPSWDHGLTAVIGAQELPEDARLDPLTAE